MPIHNSVLFETHPTDPSQRKFSPAVLANIGALMQAEVSIPDDLAQYLSANNMPIPAPVTGHALIDTGASITAVDRSIIQQLSINPVGVSTVFTPQGTAQQERYPIKLAFTGTQIVINFNSVLGSELSRQGIVALIGRDVLSHCIFIYNGPISQFSISL